jgi:hypothetical protein
MERSDKTVAIDVFTPDATVTDNDRTHVGREAILAWLRGEASDYSFTSTRIAASETDNVTIVDILLEGDFPGNRVQLRYTFDLAPGGLIRKLDIAA